VLLIVAFAGIAGPAEGQTLGQAAAAARKGPAIDPAFRSDIERLMDISGASNATTQMATSISDAFLNGFRETQKSVPPRVIEVMREVLNTEFANAFNGPEMKDRQVALYAKYFTHDDVKALLAFYQSDIGKKAIATMPDLTREGSALGQQWARANMSRVIQTLETRLKSEGLLPADASLR
jgi:hypothetical protein